MKSKAFIIFFMIGVCMGCGPKDWSKREPEFLVRKLGATEFAPSPLGHWTSIREFTPEFGPYPCF